MEYTTRLLKLKHKTSNTCQLKVTHYQTCQKTTNSQKLVRYLGLSEGSNWLKTLNMFDMFQLDAIIVCAHHIRNAKHQMPKIWTLSETSNQPKTGKLCE